HQAGEVLRNGTQAPAVSSVDVAHLSGAEVQAFAHAGGTIDKLDAIPGFSSDLSDEKFMECLKASGFVDAAQTKNLAPADKILYALRDVTGTVDSIPLIASSIMSKKLASGADAIVLDVKCGNGAFMSELDSAKQLAETMIDIGNGAGRKCSAVISDMNEPLGYTVGNLLEVKEAVDFLRGINVNERLYDLVLTICSEMYILSGRPELNGIDSKERLIRFAKQIVKDVLANGDAYKSFLMFVKGQGGETDYIENELSMDYENIIPSDVMSTDVKAEKDGYVSAIRADITGKASMHLGAGRMELEDEIDQFAGIYLKKKIGDEVKAGDVIATLYSRDKDKMSDGVRIFKEAVTISDDKEDIQPNDIIVQIQRFN
ncbi:MAG: thymidine phosphorylase, partial [Eubacterium sp.]|nr:thymidine phosphorylase [Eubacterium sp.]